MKISYNWLKKYVYLDISPKELENKMTFGGIEVESITKLGEDLDQIIIGKIEEKWQHPNADKLSICKVNDGQNVLQIICGAPNCDINQKIAFAPIGTKLGEFKIKKAKLRGEESFGMICSENELGISEEQDGIMVLPEDAPVGNSLASYLKIDDTIYDVEITPNRPDLLGIIGVARDIAALTNKKLNLPKIDFTEGENQIKNELKLQNNAEKLCTRYTARIIKNVTIKESPNWLKTRLISVGLKPINNVVDITNFVMMEYGHPLHAFDYENVNGKKIVIRQAKNGENFSALNDKIYELNENDLVIADAEKAIALAGIIGGTNSHITEKTTDIVLEVANFLYSNIRNTCRRLNLSTDSSYRFERDISDETAEIVSKRATKLILELAGGKVCEGILDSYPNPQKSTEIKLRNSRVKQLLAINISFDKIKSYLETLGLTLKSEKNDVQIYEIPTYRKDLTREIDLIEEIIRLHGYNNVETHIKLQNVMNKREFYARRKVKNILVNNGFSEVKNWSFTNPEYIEHLNISEDDIRKNFAFLKNPLGNSFSIMRPILLPDILNNAKFNINHGQKNLKLFELAKVFTRKDQKLANETFQIAGLMTGSLKPVYWKEQQKIVDFFDLKGVVEEIISRLGLSEISFAESEESFYLPKFAADIICDKIKIGSFGKMDPKIIQKFEIEQDVFVFDIDLSKIFRTQKPNISKFSEIPKFPPILQDISFQVSKEYKFNQIIEAIKSIDNTIVNVELFDEFTGKNIDENFRSLAFSIVFSSKTKTLTDEFIANLMSKIIKKLEKECKIEMR